MSEIESVVVTDEQFEVWSKEEQQFVINSPSNFYLVNAKGDKVFYLTKDRAEAQRQANLDFDSKYTIRCIRDQKTKIRNEAGIYTCRGTSTRRGQKR